jgi:hypothetical protein
LTMWIITEDVLFSCQKDNNYVLYKSDDCPIDLKPPFDLDAITALMPHKFRLLDDDGNVVYVGYCSDHAGDPLDWAMPYAGCTIMQCLDGVKTTTITIEVWNTIIG